MSVGLNEEQQQIRDAVGEICSDYPGEYWRNLDETQGYPTEFVNALTDGGWLAALIPERYGGSGLGILEASLIMEAINASGGNAAACHAQMYIMDVITRRGTEAQRRRYLPELAAGRLRLQAFGVTEPTTGSDTTQTQTRAERRGERYVVHGQKVFTSRIEHSDLMLLLVRTTPADQVDKKTRGLSILLVDLEQAAGRGIEVRPLRTMLNHHTCEVFLDGLEVPAENLIGEEGEGFRALLDGLNAERILIAAECIGDGDWFMEKGCSYARERVVFGRPIGQNQGVQFPLARAHAHIRAADLMRYQAAELYDAGRPCGPQANMAKLLAADASWEAANACLQTHGGFGFAADYDVERKFRETRLYQVAPISTNLILSYVAERVLGLPRSY
ncbi:MAG: acyl-CoA dehydrogenase [Acidobacteriia bacterium]|nr:acyl-CoA dehydrogenase [Terriglobia bacterium]MYK09045.1 acyl-CoA dehydrogenase [Terriglobia bacterium]